MPGIDFQLCLVTDRHATRGRPLPAIVEACLGAGLRAVQLREKDLPAGELFRLAGELRALTWRHRARLIVNDRADVALAVGADGVHLPSSALPPPAARRAVGHEQLLGISTHSAAEAEVASRSGVDYVLFGPVFDTPSKRSHGPPQGLGALSEVCRRSTVPVLAVGGIDASQVAAVRGAGAAGVAVVRALLEADRPADATQELLAAWRALPR